MWRWVVLVIGVLVAIGLGAWATLAISVRTGFQPVLNMVRRINRKVTNPKVMRGAGQPGSKNAVVQHKGRVSGTSYETPLVAVETNKGFAIALPYGTSPDWLKNVMSSGSAVLHEGGNSHEVVAPRVVTIREVERFFAPRDIRTNRFYGIKNALVFDKLSVEAHQ